MTSFDRPLADSAMVFDLDTEIETAISRSPQSASRTARTLLKDGPLRVTLIVLRGGGEIAEHSADGPITIHVLRGAMRLTVGDTVHTLRAGQFVSAGAGVRHAVAAGEDAVFLLTVALSGAG
jgi:quercetin dioxygenase-like cupin family protein